MSDWHMVPVFDRLQLADLAAILPPDQVRRLILGFVQELETRPSAVLELVRDGDLVGARGAAHLLLGVALNLGATRIAALATAIERAEGEAVAPLAHDLPPCARATLAELASIERTLFAAA